MIVRNGNRWFQVVVMGLLISLSMNAQVAEPNRAEPSNTKEDIAALKAQVAEQQRQLEQLRSAMQKLVENGAESRRVNPAASLGQVASTTPILPMPAVAVPKLNPAG